MQIVTLKNGSQSSLEQVSSTLRALHILREDTPQILNELVRACRNSSHINGCSVVSDVLKRHRLVLDDNDATDDKRGCDTSVVDEEIRNIVLSAVVGSGSEMIIGTPIKHNGPSLR